MKAVGAFEAKTHLSRLLDQVEAGNSIVITRHGKAVAHLVPAIGDGWKSRAQAAIEAWKKEREGIRLDGLNIRDLINEGRR